MMKIYLAKTDVLRDAAVFSELLSYVTAERREKIARFRHRADKERALAAGLLLEYGLRGMGMTLTDDGAYRKVVLITGAHGKTYLADVDVKSCLADEHGETHLADADKKSCLADAQIWFNLSHAGNYAAAVFAGAEVGIDIEQTRRYNPNLAKRFFSEEEQRFLATVCGAAQNIPQTARDAARQTAWDAAFTRLWTRKESYLKATGEGLSRELSSFSVVGDVLGKDNVYHLKTWELPDGYFLSVCCRDPSAGEPERISLIPEMFSAGAKKHADCSENRMGSEKINR